MPKTRRGRITLLLWIAALIAIVVIHKTIGLIPVIAWMCVVGLAITLPIFLVTFVLPTLIAVVVLPIVMISCRESDPALSLACAGALVGKEEYVVAAQLMMLDRQQVVD